MLDPYPDSSWPDAWMYAAIEEFFFKNGQSKSMLSKEKNTNWAMIRNSIRKSVHPQHSIWKSIACVFVASFENKTKTNGW